MCYFIANKADKINTCDKKSNGYALHLLHKLHLL